MRGIDYRRRVRANVIKRKRRVSKRYWHIDHVGMLDKGKIHCSCWMCSMKSWKDGRPISERRRIFEDPSYPI